ncbi:MAG: hypothetical protein HQK51_05895 [Oligoflexia bacterium]|nr:hypothetical protein [Oligoflexia bacterium]
MLEHESNFPLPNKQSKRTTHNANKSYQTFTIIHPFHPHYKKEFILIEIRKNSVGDKIFYWESEKTIRNIPIEWTDLFPPDLFLQKAKSKSPLHPEYLLELVKIISSLNDKIK